MHTHACRHVWLSEWVSECVCVCMCVCAHGWMYAYTHIYIYTYPYHPLHVLNSSNGQSLKECSEIPDNKERERDWMHYQEGKRKTNVTTRTTGGYTYSFRVFILSRAMFLKVVPVHPSRRSLWIRGLGSGDCELPKRDFEKRLRLVYFGCTVASRVLSCFYGSGQTPNSKHHNLHEPT